MSSMRSAYHTQSPGYIPWHRRWPNNPLLDTDSQAAQRRVLVLSPETKPAELVEEALQAKAKPWLIKNRPKVEDIRECLAEELCCELDRMFSDEPLDCQSGQPGMEETVVVIGATSESPKESPINDSRLAEPTVSTRTVYPSIPTQPKPPETKPLQPPPAAPPDAPPKVPVEPDPPLASPVRIDLTTDDSKTEDFGKTESEDMAEPGADSPLGSQVESSPPVEPTEEKSSAAPPVAPSLSCADPEQGLAWAEGQSIMHGCLRVRLLPPVRSQIIFSMEAKMCSERQAANLPAFYTQFSPNAPTLETTGHWLETVKTQTLPLILNCLQEYRSVRLLLQQIHLAHSISRLQVPVPSVFNLTQPHVTDADAAMARELLLTLDRAISDILNEGLGDSGGGPGLSRSSVFQPNRFEGRETKSVGPYAGQPNVSRRPASPDVTYVIGPQGYVTQAPPPPTGSTTANVAEEAVPKVPNDPGEPMGEDFAAKTDVASESTEPIKMGDDQMTDSTASTVGLGEPPPPAAPSPSLDANVPLNMPAAATPAAPPTEVPATVLTPKPAPKTTPPAPATKSSPVKTPPATRATKVQSAAKAKAPAAESKSARGKRQRPTPPPPPARSANVAAPARKKKRGKTFKGADDVQSTRLGNPLFQETNRPDQGSECQVDGLSPHVNISPSSKRSTTPTKARRPKVVTVDDDDDEDGGTPLPTPPEPLPKLSFCKLHGEFTRGADSTGCPQCMHVDRETAAARGFVLLKTHSSHIGRTYEMRCPRGHQTICATLTSACDSCARLDAAAAERERAQQRQQKLFEEAKWRLPHGFRTRDTKPPVVVGQYPESDPTGSLTVERLIACQSLRMVGWEVLGVQRPRTAAQQVTSQQNAKNIYKKLVMRVHPDKCQHPQSKEAFHILDAAWKAIQRPLG